MVKDELEGMLQEYGSWARVVNHIGANVESPAKKLVFYGGIFSNIIGDSDALGAMEVGLKRATIEIRTENERLKKMAYEDKLTGLQNRRRFDEAAEGEVDPANNNGDTSIVYFDVDHFKKFNDTYGHLAGDYVLEKLGDIIQKHTRDTDLSCRYGGEEFVIMLPMTDENGAYAAAEHLRRAVEDAEWVYDGKDLGRVTISLGVSKIRQGDSIEDVVKRPDEALYDAKDNGRNKTVLAADYSALE